MCFDVLTSLGAHIDFYIKDNYEYNEAYVMDSVTDDVILRYKCKTVPRQGKRYVKKVYRKEGYDG